MTEISIHIKRETESSVDTAYLGLGESAYIDGFNYAKNETVTDRINFLLKTVDGSTEARVKMATNVKEFDKRLRGADEAVFFDDFLKQTIKDILLETATVDEKQKVSDFLTFLESKGQLFSHLDETGNACHTFFDNIKEKISDEREIGLLKKRHIALMEFIARTHDLPKLLGSLNAQIDPDHEVIYREIVCKNLIGKRYKTENEEIVVFNEEDVRFIKAVAGKHEDIWREEQFAEQAKALEPNITVTEDVYIERARCIFHFIDIFGMAVSFDETNKLTIVDRVAFKSRFIDLYQRHIKLPISPIQSDGVDWTKGKVTRPEWGLHGVTGLSWTFEGLENWGIKIDPELVKEVQNGIFDVLKTAKSSLRDSLKSQQRYKPNETSKNNLRKNYRRVAMILADLKNEIGK